METGRSHRGHGVTQIKRFFSGHDIAAVKAVVDIGALTQVRSLGGYFRQIGGSDHRHHTWQSQSAAGVDAPDSSVRVRAAQDLTMQHIGQVNVGGIPRPPHNLVRPVMADGPGTHYVEFLSGEHQVWLVIQHFPSL